ncbi:LysR substrate-binding domain-containing protein [Methylacidimicrobium tartarophylax]|uniref:Hca operon transcriptional activator HcaR n=1 Tax=Methylacidimicrobium tartarophylax TaxID=1041768 RepID=A0A5E6ML80_9BACT|nr:LysR substrate-binding domain-containing protein [Methylacidimicrobium tartarophylax]VVM06184.1 Hca operon transcriptional activator HcaR [Methylacidimicrobium tartarophylax]
MELRHLRYFVAVAQYLNYSEASRRLHVAQPAISQTILDLEEELGVKLFLRNNRLVRLTAAGATFLSESEKLLAKLGEAQRLTRLAAHGEIGVLRIGFIAPAMVDLLPPLVEAYRRRYPDVDLQLTHLSPTEQLTAFDEGRLDLGFSRPLPIARRASFNEEILYRDHLYVALPPGHPLASEEKIKLETLANESFIFLLRSESPMLFDLAIETCRRAGFSPKITHQPSMIMTVFALIECKLGVGLLPGFLRGLADQKTIRRPLAEPSNPICFCTIWPKSVQRPTLNAFLEIVRSQKAALQKQIDPFVQ